VSRLAFVKPFLSPHMVTLGRCVLRGLPIPRWGNLRRKGPFSACYGFDRGTPVDRYYLERFLMQHRSDIRGDVLEIQVPAYTQRFGSDLTSLHTVDISPQFGATYTCDLASSAGVVPSNRYDCFLLPNTLCVLRDVEGCLREALRIVKPGGAILATTAVLGQVSPDGDFWRLSAAGWRELTSRAWPGCEVTVVAYGHCLAATAALQGLALEELTPAELDPVDPMFPVLVAIRCRKGTAA
jgi:hypothetical protein